MSTNNSSNIPTGVSGTILQGQGAGVALELSTATYPATTTVSQMLYSSATNTVAGLATANNGGLIANNTGVPSMLANGTVGQVLTANTAAPPSWQAPATWALQSTTTVTAVAATQDVTIPSGFTEAMIICSEIGMSGANTFLCFRFSTDSAATFVNGFGRTVTDTGSIGFYSVSTFYGQGLNHAGVKRITAKISNFGATQRFVDFSGFDTDSPSPSAGQLLLSTSSYINTFRVQLDSGSNLNGGTIYVWCR